jgi:protein O-GlcNAc transferase
MRKILLLPAVYESNAQIDATRERLAAELDEASALDRPIVTDPVRQIGVLPFYLAYHNRNNAALLRNVCRAVRRSYPAAGARELSRKRRGGRMRVGFVSTHFYSHSVGRTTIGLIRDLPRDRFSVYVFAVAPREDPLRAAIEHAADHYRSLPLALDDVRRSIESAELDVLVFADIGMHPLTYFLALWRLAPVQVTTWGHSETSGVDTIDYYWSARDVERADAQSHYSERLVRPQAFFLPGYARPAPPRPMTRRELGLPEKRRLYACLQNTFKLHPDFDAVLASLLARDPQGEILLMGSTAATMDTVRRRFARTIGADASRIRFLPKAPAPLYLSTLAAADVALDPLYFGGCNSSIDAFAVGVPVVTLPGDHLYGRFSLGLYREMALEDCVASTPAEYVDIAHRLASEPDFRETQHHALCERSGVLYERADITLAYADFLEREAFAAT